ncbi:hypothetical protein NDU88_003743, partial [Pleurodeles waltl]
CLVYDLRRPLPAWLVTGCSAVLCVVLPLRSTLVSPAETLLTVEPSSLSCGVSPVPLDTCRASIRSITWVIRPRPLATSPAKWPISTWRPTVLLDSP